MKITLTICSECERHVLRRPRQGKALAAALTGLTRLLQDRKRLQGMEVVRKPCLQNCPLGKLCVALKRGDQEVCHHLSAEDDLPAVAAKLAGTSRGGPSAQPG